MEWQLTIEHSINQLSHTPSLIEPQMTSVVQDIIGQSKMCAPDHPHDAASTVHLSLLPPSKANTYG